MKRIIRLTEGDLHKIVRRSINEILADNEYTPVPDNIEQMIIDGINNGGKIWANDGDNEHEVVLDDGTTVMINFFVDYKPEAPNHPSSSYEEDQTGFGDKYDIFVSDMYWVDENYEDYDLNIDTSGIEDALMNMVEVEYTGTDDDRAAYWE